jgi:hypothetical protein
MYPEDRCQAVPAARGRRTGFKDQLRLSGISPSAHNHGSSGGSDGGRLGLTRVPGQVAWLSTIESWADDINQRIYRDAVEEEEEEEELP